MIVRMRLRTWEDAFTGANFALPIKVVNNPSSGFLEVYETLTDLHKDYPDEKFYVEIEPV